LCTPQSEPSQYAVQPKEKMNIDKELNKLAWMKEEFIRECRRMTTIIEKQQKKIEEHLNDNPPN